MERHVSDEDILLFLRKNWKSYTSQIHLMQDAIHLLWPGNPPVGSNERVVRLCLEESRHRPAVW
jgi:hypothetical protein